MELLDRYLQAVKRYLPWQRQDDILAELRANLESQLEDQEAEIGRPLNTVEVERWLKQLGSPMQVAGRYQPQQYLIGPSVFPMYWYVMQMALLWMLAVYAVVVAVQVFSEPEPSFNAVWHAALRLPGVLMATGAWVTLIFAVLEFLITHYPTMWPEVAAHFSEWSPASLPPLERHKVSGKKPRSYAQAVAEVIFGFLFLGWLLSIPQHPVLLFGPGWNYMKIWGASSSTFKLAPVWALFYWSVVALNTIQLAWRCVHLARGSWRQSHPVQQIAMKVLGLIPWGVLLADPDRVYVLFRDPAVNQPRNGAIADQINRGTHQIVLLLSVIVVAQLLWETGKLGLDAYRKRRAVMR
jgi:hypothetical protein